MICCSYSFAAALVVVVIDFVSSYFCPVTGDFASCVYKYLSLFNFRLLDTEVYILFPYRFDFGKSLDKLLIVNKMLKQLYRKPRVASKDPLYADVWVKLKVRGIRFVIYDQMIDYILSCL